eukprot:TRINITY_DN3091_c0_g1_i1.p2 TRINITY_DN3091_c0_g1~~TRINITY_DN3091_c0_g1_i1.p2  ORF type:complete len:135 (+),score=7.55 TRINITY_DN3091_c0_g1_i1:1214-1618(+)
MENDILSIDNSDPLHPSVRTFRAFVIFKHTPKYLLLKWCHFIRTCTCCGLSGHLAPACPLKDIYITLDILTITHADPNPPISFIKMTYPGEIIVPDTPISDITNEKMDHESPQRKPNVGKKNKVLIKLSKKYGL